MARTPHRAPLSLIVTLAALLAAASLTACNTVEGAGKDIEKAGEAIQKSVK